MALSLGLAIRKADRIRGRVTDEQLARMATKRRLRIVEGVPFPGEGLVEATALGRLYLKRGLTHAWWRWLVPHGLSHHLCDAGNQVELYRAVGEDVLARQQERRAEELAGWVHFADYVRAEPELDPVAMAEWADVPVECVRRWLDLVGWRLQELRQRYCPATRLHNKLRQRPPSVPTLDAEPTADR